MALDVPVTAFFDLVGHNGGDIVNDSLPDPLCRAGIHVQEAISASWKLGYTATPIELFPVAKPLPESPSRIIEFCDGNWKRFVKHIRGGRGVIECHGRYCGHAVAFDKGRIYDPDGGEFDYSQEACEKRNLITHRLWRLEKRK